MNDFFLEKRFVYQQDGVSGSKDALPHEHQKTLKEVRDTKIEEIHEEASDKLDEFKMRMEEGELMGNKYLWPSNMPKSEWYDKFERLDYDQAVRVLEAFKPPEKRKPDESPGYWGGFIDGFYGKTGPEVDYEIQLMYYHYGYDDGKEMGEIFDRK